MILEILASNPPKMYDRLWERVRKIRVIVS